MNRDFLRQVIHTTLEAVPELWPLVNFKAAVASGRDDREPGKDRKERFEKKLSRLIQARFQIQAERIEQALTIHYPGRKALTTQTTWLNDINWQDAANEADLVLLLIEATKDGIDLFKDNAVIGIDYTLVNSAAVEWAQKYVGKWIKGIDETTLNAVQSAIAAFVQTPGMTIGDVVNLLPFDDARAWRIAVTEITRAYGQSELLAGQELRDEYPDIQVTKTWFTKNDEIALKCDICGPLNGVEIDIDEEFDTGIDAPPAHVNCRCWMSTRTRINAE